MRISNRTLSRAGEIIRSKDLPHRIRNRSSATKVRLVERESGTTLRRICATEVGDCSATALGLHDLLEFHAIECRIAASVDSAEIDSPVWNVR